MYSSGASVNLPVTEDDSFAPVQGQRADGYEVQWLPGIRGEEQTSLLARTDVIELPVGGLTQQPIWRHADLTQTLVDQNGTPIPASQFELRGLAGLYSSGASVNLPVTEDDSFAPVRASDVDGYEVQWFPGIRGEQQTSLLARTDVVELPVGGLTQQP